MIQSQKHINLGAPQPRRSEFIPCPFVLMFESVYRMQETPFFLDLISLLIQRITNNSTQGGIFLGGTFREGICMGEEFSWGNFPSGLISRWVFFLGAEFSNRIFSVSGGIFQGRICSGGNFPPASEGKTRLFLPIQSSSYQFAVASDDARVNDQLGKSET